MLVVPNKKSAAKIPSLTGMMIYRTDTQKLYVQGDKRLKLIAEQEVFFNSDLLFRVLRIRFIYTCNVYILPKARAKIYITNVHYLYIII